MPEAPSRQGAKAKTGTEQANEQRPCRSQHPGQGKVHKPPQEPEWAKEGGMATRGWGRAVS